MRKFRIGIALGGGGVRGLAHIGVLSVLHKNGIIPDMISGTSMGAIIGALYAGTPDPETLNAQAEKIIQSGAMEEISSYFYKAMPKRPLGRFISMVKQFFITNIAAVRPSILSEEHVKKIFSLIPLAAAFSDLEIPFCAVSTDIGRGEEKDFTSGDLPKAVAASSSIAGIFPPVNISGSLYLDGSTVNSVPVSPLRKYCDFTIACDVRPKRRIIPSFKLGLEVLSRTEAISSYKLSDLQIESADFVIRPDVGKLHWANFKKYAESIRKGAEACEESITDLKKKISKAKLSGFPARLLGRRRHI